MTVKESLLLIGKIQVLTQAPTYLIAVFQLICKMVIITSKELRERSDTK
jgi:hypothetical protein